MTSDRPKYFRLNPDHSLTPCSSAEWAKAFGDIEGRRVAWEEFEGKSYVSTVFLGVDHASGDNPPELFESMVFGGEIDGEQRRYATWDEAVQGHTELVATAKRLINGRLPVGT